ncbi:MAG TPA: GNAT family N-acetyltransferase [Gemmatimonadales bacterium]
MSGPPPQPALLTPRLRLRSFDTADAEAVQRLAGAFAVADTTLTIPHPYEDGMAEAWIAMLAEEFAIGRQAVFAITDRATAALIGAVGLVLRPEHARAELGYWIGRPFWGLGYATEAARETLRYGFGPLGLHRIHASYFARNPASGRVLSKAGMRPEGVARGHVRRWDRYEDLVQYGILREEFVDT